VLYASTLDDMGIPRSALRPSMAPFHGVVPGIEALPLGQIDLPVTFRDVRNFRTKTLTFEVVGFSRTYHVSGIHPGYSCKEGRIVEDGLLVEFPCTPIRTRSVYSY
jgi:hypothetical protein